MIVADGPDGEEVTTKIDGTQLAELVQTTSPASHERVTSRIPAVTLEGLLDAAPMREPVLALARAPTPTEAPMQALTQVPAATPLPLCIAPPPLMIDIAPNVDLPPPRRRLRSGVIVAISCISTLLIGLVVGALLV